MTSIPFNGSLLKSLIEIRFGGVDELLDSWGAGYPRTGDDENTPDRSTIYRWIDGAWPRTSLVLFRLSALLDVDPVCFLVVSADSAAQSFSFLHKCYVANDWRPRSLNFLAEFIGQQRGWPPESVAAQLGRPWIVREEPHDLSKGRNLYARFELKSPPSAYEMKPQVFHIAYRHGARFGTLWVQYAYIVRHCANARLVNIDGQVLDARVEDGPTFFETYFGPNPTKFRIASFNEFNIQVSIAANQTQGAMRT